MISGVFESNKVCRNHDFYFFVGLPENRITSQEPIVLEDVPSPDSVASLAKSEGFSPVDSNTSSNKLSNQLINKTSTDSLSPKSFKDNVQEKEKDQENKVNTSPSSSYSSSHKKPTVFQRKVTKSDKFCIPSPQTSCNDFKNNKTESKSPPEVLKRVSDKKSNLSSQNAPGKILDKDKSDEDNKKISTNTKEQINGPGVGVKSSFIPVKIKDVPAQGTDESSPESRPSTTSTDDERETKSILPPSTDEKDTKPVTVRSACATCINKGEACVKTCPNR
ncbi:hypothetical protein JYU34_004789 [Plutella xylostella]|uniref:4Fe-4S ferredoxin-type domain-containing protein n=1 Tax=Plutella xylostella TaxID=51655 RepID=A0ABQ7QYV6_PLUXY|nr:hypothetical protein JYU34_004789 [Plutella xylostella]